MANSQIAEMVDRLNQLLGHGMVASLAGAETASIAERWAEPTGKKPPPDAVGRLKIAANLAEYLVPLIGRVDTRTWFSEPRIQLKGSDYRLTPTIALRNSTPGDEVTVRLWAAAYEIAR